MGILWGYYGHIVFTTQFYDECYFQYIARKCVCLCIVLDYICLKAGSRKKEMERAKGNERERIKEERERRGRRI